MTRDEFPAPLTLDTAALADPVSILEADHARQKQVCEWIENFLDDLGDRPIVEEATRLLRFFTADLDAHMRDEEGALFPLLRRRCAAEEGIKAILDRLTTEHELDKDIVDFIVEDLKAMAAGKKVPNPTRFIINIGGFAETQRRHLAWENDTVLPLARSHLTDEDLKALAAAFAAHHGLA